MKQGNIFFMFNRYSLSLLPTYQTQVLQTGLQTGLQIGLFGTDYIPSKNIQSNTHFQRYFNVKSLFSKCSLFICALIPLFNI
jgi:hypothetical protein